MASPRAAGGPPGQQGRDHRGDAAEGEVGADAEAADVEHLAGVGHELRLDAHRHHVHGGEEDEHAHHRAVRQQAAHALGHVGPHGREHGGGVGGVGLVGRRLVQRPQSRQRRPRRGERDGVGSEGEGRTAEAEQGTGHGGPGGGGGRLRGLELAVGGDQPVLLDHERHRGALGGVVEDPGEAEARGGDEQRRKVGARQRPARRRGRRAGGPSPGR